MRLKHLNNSKAFTEFSSYTGVIYKSIEEYNSNQKLKIMTEMKWLLLKKLKKT